MFEQPITIRVICLGGVRHQRLSRAGMSLVSGSVSAVQGYFNPISRHRCGQDRIHQQQCFYMCFEYQEKFFGNRQDSLFVCFQGFLSLKTFNDASLHLDIRNAAFLHSHLKCCDLT